MTITNFELTQQAVEMALAHVDFLREQGKSRGEAIYHAVQRFGIPRHKLVALLNDRDFGLMGTSGETEISVVSTPTSPIGVE